VNCPVVNVNGLQWLGLWSPIRDAYWLMSQPAILIDNADRFIT
jgi:hypothetical protein